MNEVAMNYLSIASWSFKLGISLRPPPFPFLRCRRLPIRKQIPIISHYGRTSTTVTYYRGFSSCNRDRCVVFYRNKCNSRGTVSRPRRLQFLTLSYLFPLSIPIWNSRWVWPMHWRQGTKWTSGFQSDDKSPEFGVNSAKLRMKFRWKWKGQRCEFVATWRRGSVHLWIVNNKTRNELESMKKRNFYLNGSTKRDRWPPLSTNKILVFFSQSFLRLLRTRDEKCQNSRLTEIGLVPG